MVQLIGALVRALLVMVAIAIPALLLPDPHGDGNHIIAIVALFAGAMVFVEYASAYPGLIEFRDAPPYNRIRYLGGVAVLFLLASAAAAVESGSDGTFSILLLTVGQAVADGADIPFGPVSLMLTTADPADPQSLDMLRAMLGLSLLVAAATICVCVVSIRFGAWPNPEGAFNVWINLPLFDPTGTSDVIETLRRDARINLALGVLVPFLLPLGIVLGLTLMGPPSLASAQTAVWTVTAWTMIPVCLLMRAIALSRVADMIAFKRRSLRDEAPGAFVSA